MHRYSPNCLLVRRAVETILVAKGVRIVEKEIATDTTGSETKIRPLHKVGGGLHPVNCATVADAKKLESPAAVISRTE